MRAPYWMDTVTLSGETLRLSTVGLLAPSGTYPIASREGVRPSPQGTDMKIQAQTVAGNTCNILPGVCYIVGDSANVQGTYIGVNDSTTTVGPFSNPHATLSRIDLVIARVYDKAYLGGSEADMVVEIVTGAPASTPSVPALPANSIALAQVTILPHTSGGAIISSGNIVDTRRFVTALGGVIPMTASDLTGYTGYNGQQAYETDTKKLKTWTSSNAWELTGGVKAPRGVIAQYNTTPGYTATPSQEYIVWTPVLYIDTNRWIKINWVTSAYTSGVSIPLVLRIYTANQADLLLDRFRNDIAASAVSAGTARSTSWTQVYQSSSLHDGGTPLGKSLNLTFENGTTGGGTSTLNLAYNQITIEDIGGY